MEWEGPRDENIARTKIPGGWLVKLHSCNPGGQTGICFVPDKNHEWDWYKDQ